MVKSIPSPTRTTESLITGLRHRAERGEDTRQQIIAHETLARLRGERAAATDGPRIRDLDDHIRYWRSLVDEDIDPDTTAAVTPTPTES